MTRFPSFAAAGISAPVLKTATVPGSGSSSISTGSATRTPWAGGRYRFFYRNGEPVQRENDLHIMYRLTWCATTYDANREVNNGRGPVDFKVSKGNADKTLIEFKLASNSKLKQNLKHQVGVYETANDTAKSIKAILYFSDTEFRKVQDILKELGLLGRRDVVLIDASDENKPSASKVTDATQDDLPFMDAYGDGCGTV